MQSIWNPISEQFLRVGEAFGVCDPRYFGGLHGGPEAGIAWLWWQRDTWRLRGNTCGPLGSGLPVHSFCP